MRKLLQTIGLAVFIIAMNSCQKNEVELEKTRPDNLPENVTRAPNGDYIVTLADTRSGTTRRYRIPDDLYYTEDHTWIRSTYYDPIQEWYRWEFGITDFYANCGIIGAQIVFISFYVSDYDSISNGDYFGEIEGTGAVSALPSPMSGVFREANESVLESPECLHEDPYSNYLCIIIEMERDRTDLMYSNQYEDFIEGWMTAEEYVEYLLE